MVRAKDLFTNQGPYTVASLGVLPGGYYDNFHKSPKCEHPSCRDPKNGTPKLGKPPYSIVFC